MDFPANLDVGRSHNAVQEVSRLFNSVALFNGISTFMGYLMSSS